MMQFNSYEYIFAFIPALLLLYYPANKIHPAIGKIVIIISSVLFYSFGRIEMLKYLAISMAVNYLFVVVIKRKGIRNRLVIAMPITINIIALLYFKYSNFAIANICAMAGIEFTPLNIILPLGISFYTFQQIAYIVSVEKGLLKGINVIDYASYILFFPKLLMGPLMDPCDFIEQINDFSRKRLDVDHIAAGVKLFSFGLIKKVLFADTFGKAVSWVYTNLDGATSMDCFLLMIFYTFEIYFDFSGYSDMAVGTSAMLNIDLPINFDSPYKALSIRDFWKRWHISLTSFFTKYIYIPLGGSRKGKLLTYLNTMIVFLISGFWHGANWTFVLWGVLHGILCCADRFLEKAEERVFIPVRWICTFFSVSVLWLLFNSESIGQWRYILTRMVSMYDTTVSDGLIDKFSFTGNEFLINVLRLNSVAYSVRGFNILAFLLVSALICLVPENNYIKRDRIDICSLLFASVAFVGGVLCLGTESSFVYLGF